MKTRINKDSHSKTLRLSCIKTTSEFIAQIFSNLLRRFPLAFPFLLGVLSGFLLTSWPTTSKSLVTTFIDGSDHFVENKHLTPPTDRVDVPYQLFTTYLQDFQTKVDGWISREIFYVIWTVGQYQYDHLHLAGGIGEIGVHHGKFTCFLYLMRRFHEQNLFAVDVFDNQALNKDGSGRGQKDLFLSNIRQYADIHRNELALYAGSSLDLNPTFSTNQSAVQWWRKEGVGTRGLQLVSIDGGHTSLLTYSDLCLVSNWMVDGGVVAVDDITHPGWLGVRDGVGKFFTETSKLLTDMNLEDELAARPNVTNFELSRRVVEATNLDPWEQGRSPCSRLVPFLQFFNKLFLTTPKYYPYYIELLGEQEHFANAARSAGMQYLQYNALRLMIGNVPIWTENFDYTLAQKEDLFRQYIEPIWQQKMHTTLNRKA